MEFSVTILGSGSAVPTSGRGLTSQYIQCRGRSILIDCGEGTQMQVRRFGIKFQRIDHVFISHLHGDHYFGLVGLLSSMHLMGRKRSIHIYGPPGLKEIVEMQLHYGGARLAFDVFFSETDVSGLHRIFEDNKITVDSFPLAHRIPTTGFLIREKERERHLIKEAVQRDGIPMEYYHRLKKGENIRMENGRELKFEDYTTSADLPKSYAFCSDTAYRDEVAAYVEGVDLLYHEATFTMQHAERARATMHSTAQQAAELAKKAGVKRLLMGHLSARYDSPETHEREARAVFPASEMATDGDTYFV